MSAFVAICFASRARATAAMRDMASAVMPWRVNGCRNRRTRSLVVGGCFPGARNGEVARPGSRAVAPTVDRALRLPAHPAVVRVCALRSGPHGETVARGAHTVYSAHARWDASLPDGPRHYLMGRDTT